MNINLTTVADKLKNQLLGLIPLVWLVVFLALPFLILLRISFSEPTIQIPPYLPLFEWETSTLLSINMNFKNYFAIFKTPLYSLSFLNSLTLAAISTFFCLLIAYPMALYISRTPARYRNLLLLLIILPFWTSFLIRVYAWVGLLNTNGLINNFLIWTGLIKDPLPLINNSFAVCVGIVYSYLPFMILPLYVAIEKMDLQYLEAAYDLGCPPWKAFWKITFPISLPGVLTGAMTVFIPAVGEFVIPVLLGGVDNIMIGKLLWIEFFKNADWPKASALAIVMLGALFVPLVILFRLSNRLAVK